MNMAFINECMCETAYNEYRHICKTYDSRSIPWYLAFTSVMVTSVVVVVDDRWRNVKIEGTPHAELSVVGVARGLGLLTDS